MYIYGFNLSTFVICVNIVELIYVKICHEAKLQAFVKMHMAPSQLKSMQTRRIFRKRNKVTLAKLLSKLTRPIFVSTCSLRFESLLTVHDMGSHFYDPDRPIGKCGTHGKRGSKTHFKLLPREWPYSFL